MLRQCTTQAILIGRIQLPLTHGRHVRPGSFERRHPGLETALFRYLQEEPFGSFWVVNGPILIFRITAGPRGRTEGNPLKAAVRDQVRQSAAQPVDMAAILLQVDRWYGNDVIGAVVVETKQNLEFILVWLLPAAGGLVAAV